MKQTLESEKLEAAFREAEPCMRANQCKKFGEAMCVFYQINNKHVAESGEGIFIFAETPSVECPNRDQLFCQDREEL